MINLPVPRKEVLASHFEDGEGVLVDLDTKSYYQLNETAMLVWQALEKAESMREIVNKITSTYQVTEPQATESLKRIIRDFESRKLLQPRLAEDS